MIATCRRAALGGQFVTGESVHDVCSYILLLLGLSLAAPGTFQLCPSLPRAFRCHQTAVSVLSSLMKYVIDDQVFCRERPSYFRHESFAGVSGNGWSPYLLR